MPKRNASQIIINLDDAKFKSKSKRQKEESSSDSESDSDKYEVKFEKKYGTRQEVIDGIAQKTKGNLTKSDFVKNPRGKYVSKAASLKAAQNWEKGEEKRRQRFISQLIKLGYKVVDPQGQECVIQEESAAEEPKSPEAEQKEEGAIVVAN